MVHDWLATPETLFMLKRHGSKYVNVMLMSCDFNAQVSDIAVLLQTDFVEEITE